MCLPTRCRSSRFCSTSFATRSTRWRPVRRVNSWSPLLPPLKTWSKSASPIPAAASRRKLPTSSFNHSSPPKPTAWALDCRSRARSLNRTAARSDRARIRAAARSSPSRCRLLTKRRTAMASENAAAQRAVHVIDDDEGLRESLAFLLRSAGLDVKSFNSAKAFLKVLPDATLGCVISDIRMPDMSGIELLRRLKELKVGVPVIVITGHGDVALAVEAMKIGAADFFEKPFDDNLLVASVRTALRQQADQTKRGAERADIEHRISTLSPREKDVLTGLVDGRANKQIAFDLGISPRTVEIYRANLMNKMQAGSLSDLVRMALLIQMLGSAEPGEH